MEYELKTGEIFIYGAASYGKRIYEKFFLNGYNVAGFIDKRAHEIKEFFGKRVFTFEEFFEKNFSDPIIFIAVKNVFEHSSISYIFLQHGIKKIIFRPFSVLMGNSDTAQEQLNKVYTCIDENRFEEINKIPEIVEDTRFVLNRKNRFPIWQNEEMVVANIPWQFVFTNHNSKKNSIWTDVNIGQIFPHISFFLYLLGVPGENFEEYIHFCIDSARAQGDIKTTDQWIGNIIRNRKIVFNQMNLMYELDRDFFIRNAPEAIWNPEEHYFNLTGGKHRSCFLLSKGNKCIPLKVKKHDYRKYSNSLLLKELSTKTEMFLEHRILHPMFFRLYPEGEFADQIEKIILRDLSKNQFYSTGIVSIKKKKMLIALENNGNGISRSFCILGMDITEVKKETNEKADIIDELLGVAKKRKFIPNLSSMDKERYDYILVDEESLKNNCMELQDLHDMYREKLFLICTEKIISSEILKMKCIYSGFYGIKVKKLYAETKG